MNAFKPLYITFSLIICFMLSGCGDVIKSEYKRYTHKDDDSSNYSDLAHNKSHDESKIITFGTNHIDEKQHVNNTLAYNSELTNKVNSIDGVADARVFVTDKNVYVAVVLDYTGRNYAISKDYIYQNNPSTSAEQPNEIANNPFAGYVSVNDPTQLTNTFKQTIAETIFAKEGQIDEVHISANKDFMFYMDEFAQVAKGKEDVNKYLKQFNILVQHQFANGHIMPTSLDLSRNK